MATLNELKYASMASEVSPTIGTSLNELEHLWLTLKGVSAGGTLNERWYELFGQSDVKWNEAAHLWLTAQGIPEGGTLNERWYQYWSGGGVITPAFWALTPDPNTYEMLGVRTGVGGLTVTHAEPIYAADHEGIYREAAANEPVWEGGRVVRNIILHSNDFTDVAWQVQLGGTKVGATTIDGVDCMEVSLNTNADARIKQQFEGLVSEGDTVRGTFMVRSKSGTIDLRVKTGSVYTSNVSVGESWVRVSGDLFTQTTGARDFAVGNSDPGVAKTFYVAEAQLEIVNGQTNQNPSEYVPTTTAAVTRVYGNSNGNTVDGNNVVSEGVGLPLLEGGGRVVTNHALHSEDASNPYWIKSNATITSGKTDPDGGVTAGRLTATGTNGTIYKDVTGAGETACNTCWIRRVTGTGEVYLRLPNTGYAGSEITAQLTTEWQRFSKTGETGGTGRFGVTLGTSGDEVDVAFFQAEIVDGQTNQNPGEYVPTTTAPASQTFRTTNGNTVVNNVVIEGAGDPIPEAPPYLKYQPAATNELLYSRDLTNAAWTKLASVITSYDQTGLDGGTTATLVNDNNASGFDGVRQEATVSDDSNTHTVTVFIAKDSDETRFPEFQFRITGGTSAQHFFRVNTKTGAYNTISGSGNVEVIDEGDFWSVNSEITNNSTGNTLFGVLIYPAASTAISGGAQPSATGSIIVGNCELHLNKTIAEVRGLGPIFTTSAAGSTDAFNAVFDPANKDGAASAWYVEFTNDSPSGGASNIFHYVLNTSNSPNNSAIVLRYNARFPRLVGVRNGEPAINLPPQVGGEHNKFSTIYDANQPIATVNANGVYGAESTATVNLLTQLSAGGASFVGKVRELRRYDIDSYQQGKDIIDGLMA